MECTNKKVGEEQVERDWELEVFFFFLIHLVWNSSFHFKLKMSGSKFDFKYEV